MHNEVIYNEIVKQYPVVRFYRITFLLTQIIGSPAAVDIHEVDYETIQ